MPQWQWLGQRSGQDERAADPQCARRWPAPHTVRLRFRPLHRPSLVASLRRTFCPRPILGRAKLADTTTRQTRREQARCHDKRDRRDKLTLWRPRRLGGQTPSRAALASSRCHHWPLSSATLFTHTIAASSTPPSPVAPGLEISRDLGMYLVTATKRRAKVLIAPASSSGSVGLPPSIKKRHDGCQGRDLSATKPPALLPPAHRATNGRSQRCLAFSPMRDRYARQLVGPQGTLPVASYSSRPRKLSSSTLARRLAFARPQSGAHTAKEGNS